jgi:hypothetical protein
LPAAVVAGGIRVPQRIEDIRRGFPVGIPGGGHERVECPHRQNEIDVRGRVG